MNKKEILDIDRNNIWHPFTRMKDYEKLDHIAIKRAKGLKLYDVDGKSYYDTISSWWTNLHGHCHPLINDALTKQVKKLEHVNFSGFTHKPATKLVSLLKNFLSPVLTRFFFSDNGSTATEVALKLSFQYYKNRGIEGKTKFVYLKNSYHGDTIGSVSVGGMESFHGTFRELCFSSFMVDGPHCSKCKAKKQQYTLDATDISCDNRCFETMRSLLTSSSSEIAAVIIEPLIQCAGGMINYPPKYLRELRNLTKELNIHLIYDEVATGFGRTGSMFAYQQTATVPDFICLSKGLSGGYMPLGLTVTTDEIYEPFYNDNFDNKSFYHGHSYTANPLACSTGIASLKIFESEKLPYSKVDVIEKFHSELTAFTELDFVSDVRFLGFIGAVDIVSDLKNRLQFPDECRIGYRIYMNSLKAGLVLRPLGDIIYWFLPLAVNEDDIRAIMKKSIKVIKDTVYEVRKEFNLSEATGSIKKTRGSIKEKTVNFI